MEKSKLIFLAKVATVFSVIPILIYAFATGPDPRKTNAPGDQNCTQAACHVGTALNAGGGNVRLEFADGMTYSPGQRKRITVIITDSAARVYGFQMSSRPASNAQNGQAGTFTTVTPNTEIICENASLRPAAGCPASAPLEFIQHTQPRSEGRFEVDWTAPDSDLGDINFYVAANAANGNTQNTGDRIYATTATLTFAQAGGQRPVISQGGVVNAGSGAPAIASGTWISIFGQNLAPAMRVLEGSDIQNNRLPTTLGDVSVEIQGQRGFLSFVSPTQINVLVPDFQDTGNVRVEVVSGSNRSEVASVNKERISPAFLPFVDAAGKRYIAARHADFSILGKADLFQGLATTPARPGEVILLYGVGFGPTQPAVAAGTVPSEIARTTEDVRVLFGDIPATVSYAGVSPGSAGLYQLNVAVPDTVPNGDIAVRAEIGGLRTQENIFITVQR